MIVPSSRTASRARRFVGAAVMLFVFFLPLHIHFFTSTTKVNNDCACAYNTKTQAAPIAAAIQSPPAFHATIVVLHEAQGFGSDSAESYAIRAPPSSTSL